ncbi:hypothetical protein ACPCTG_31675 [Streptomyces pseudogriseolus]|uniref:hypothetical protein n=1 Tax=Streptomyces pseudogriseolus TaxID=36817 RepID=UPI003FA293AF
MTDRPTIEDLDAPLESSRWCCAGNAEDCALCTDPNPPYPCICPGHPRTTANERIVGETVQASGRAVREVRIVVEAPTEENADQWAATIRDLVLAEHGEDMRLNVTIHPGGQS